MPAAQEHLSTGAQGYLNTLWPLIATALVVHEKLKP